MQIFVDADACLVVGIVEAIAEKYNTPATLQCDTNHVLYSEKPIGTTMPEGQNQLCRKW